MRVPLRTRDSYVADTLTEQQQVVLPDMHPAIPHTFISGRLHLVRLVSAPRGLAAFVDLKI